MTTIVVHTLNAPNPFRIIFDSKFDSQMHDAYEKLGFMASTSMKSHRDANDGSYMDAFLITSHNRAFASEDEVVAFLREKNAPVADGLREALKSLRGREHEKWTADIEFTPNLLTAGSYRIYTCRDTYAGEENEVAEYETLEEAKYVIPAFASGSVSVRVGSVVVSEYGFGKDSKSYVHPAFETLLKREAMAVLAPRL